MPRTLNSDFVAVRAGTGRYSSKGEDRDCSNISHEEYGLPDFGSFGVFDGHYGVRSATLCSQHLNAVTMARMKKLEEKLYQLVNGLKEDTRNQNDPVINELIEFLMSEDMRDAMLVESIRATTQIMDHELRKVDKSGTTAVCLFVRRQREGEALRVLVSNVGDSRCVLFAPKKGKICKSASSVSLSSVDNAETKYDEGPSSLSKLTGTFMKMMKNTPLGGGLKKRDAEAFSAFCSTRDHSLTHIGERQRVSRDNDVNIDWGPFPVEILASTQAINTGPVVHIVPSTTPSGSPVDRRETTMGEPDGETIDDSLNGANEDMIFYDDLNQSVHFEQDSSPRSRSNSNSRSRSNSNSKPVDSNYSPFEVTIGSPQRSRSLAVPIPIPASGDDARNLHQNSENLDSRRKDSPSVSGSGGSGSLQILANSKVSVLDPLEQQTLSRTPEEAILVDSFFCGQQSTTAIDYHITSRYILKAREIIGRKDYPPHSTRTMLATATLSYFTDESKHNDDMGVRMSAGAVDDGVFQYDPKDARHYGAQTHKVGVSKKVTPIDIDVTTLADLSEGFKPVRSNSFISSRVSSSGVKGPEALFGRFKISVSMTRSLGGRYGPRRCICLPDVIGMDVQPGQRIRCVLATDGLWDVVGLTSIAKVLSKHQSPALAAKVLTEKALKRREDRGLRLDDITVVVVDVQAQETGDAAMSTSV